MALYDELQVQMRLDKRRRDEEAGLLGGGSVPSVAGLGQTDRKHAQRETVLPFNLMALNMVDAVGVVAYASQKIFDFPAGVVRVNSVAIDLTLTRSSAGVNTLWDGDIALGTVAAAGDATLTGTEATFLASTATPQAVAGVSKVAAVNSTPQILNGALPNVAPDMYLNLLVDDSDHDVTSTPAQIGVSGTVTILWELLSAAA